ncbi:hypothetical protein [Kitasatospora indigofera]|uniref:hypothetical protein n=1 Tax=Kitasatospora indigofera TaxID=67307 RepID=UPI00367ABF15
MLDLGNYELLWPADVFVAEVEHIAAAGQSDWTSRAEWLLTEAFQGEGTCSDFKSLPVRTLRTVDRWGQGAPPATGPVITQWEWLRELADRAQEVRQFTAPLPYWPRRREGAAPPAAADPSSVRLAFVRLIIQMQDNGYLVEHFGKACVDDYDDLPDAAGILELRLDVPGLWPLRPEEWDEDTFFGLVEVFHDLVSRPRDRSFHAFNGCGWHYKEFHIRPARMLYRWRVNRILADAGLHYRLADEGEDLGRLVAVTDDARANLVHRAMAVTDPDIKQRTAHAIALYRSRSASVEEKRSAIIALAGILEERRDLIRAELGKPDDSALFQIANRFEIRHRDASQQDDYDPAFLDWIFWWYLATVELTTILAHRQQTSGW